MAKPWWYMALPMMPVLASWELMMLRSALRTLLLYGPKLGSSPEARKTIKHHPGDARPLLAALPVALLGLGLGQVLQAAVVHLAHVARDDLAGTAGEPLGSGRGGQPQEEGQGGDAAGQRATSRDRGMIPGGMPTSSWA